MSKGASETLQEQEGEGRRQDKVAVQVEQTLRQPGITKAPATGDLGTTVDWMMDGDRRKALRDALRGE